MAIPNVRMAISDTVGLLRCLYSTVVSLQKLFAPLVSTQTFPVHAVPSLFFVTSDSKRDAQCMYAELVSVAKLLMVIAAPLTSTTNFAGILFMEHDESIRLENHVTSTEPVAWSIWVRLQVWE